MSDHLLAFFQDRLAPEARPRTLAPSNRVIYVRHGRARIGGEPIDADQAWHGSAPVSVAATSDDVLLWRWELLPAAGAAARTRNAGLAHPIATLERGDGWLMRCDSVSFPPGGCAYTHVHQGPGIRCLAEGSITIESAGETTRYGPDEPWYESGPEPVFAEADPTVPTRFIRVMILPRALLGQRSITYIRDEDRDKPKVQTYRLYIDQPICV